VTLALALWLAWPDMAGSHEIGTTQVQFVIHANHTWSGTITTAPTVLVNRLEVQAGKPRSSDLAADAVREKLTQLGAALTNQVDVRFDGRATPVAISIEQVEIPDDVTRPAFITLRAEGRIPDSARTVTWRWLPSASTYAVTFSDDRGGASMTQWLDGDAPSRPFPLVAAARPPRGTDIFRQYLELGFAHIVPEGIDHVLFVLGIFLLSPRLRPILIQVTAFTIAHSLTLGLMLYGVFSLPAGIVEPLIALSIAYVGIENIVTSTLTPWRPVLVFGFGLLHGMGFAGVLDDLHLPHDEILPALLSFNLGIELAQLAVIGAAFLTVGLWFRDRSWYRARIVIPASAAIAVVGLMWTAERLFSP
jgi:hydrogenase/urease accessory protein HupE